MNPSFIKQTDFYKADHRRQYPEGTQYVYSNFTPRSSRVDGVKHVVHFGLQYFLQRYLGELAKETFFECPVNQVCDDYQRMLDTSLGPNDIGTDHIRELHAYGRLPLEFCALPEGTAVPLRVPMWTVENTHPEFFWVTNYIETLISNVLWLPCTSATTAARYRALLNGWARDTGGDEHFVPWQGHDFSSRGMGCPEASALSGAGHLLSFTGTDTIPAIELLERYYGAKGLVGGSVAATEHSVMCAGSQECERDTFERLLALYPKGVVSVVSDTWDLWNVVTEILPSLKDKIMGRDGKLVIRPDSGDPVKIICGDPHAIRNSDAFHGLIELLWDTFGGSLTTTKHKLLDSHIGAIYGDSITYQRAEEICEGLVSKGFATTNVVLGIGSFTYQYVTRDTFGHAIKATWAQVHGEERFLSKSPITDDGTKKSARGRLAIIRDGLSGELRLVDGMTKAEQANCGLNLLQPVWREGYLLRLENLSDIRERMARHTQEIDIT